MTERQYKDSGIEWIGDIPANWHSGHLKRLAKIKTGNTPSRSVEEYYSEKVGVPWIKPENLNSYDSINNTAEYLSTEGRIAGTLFPKNTVFTCCIASIGKIGYSNIEASCNQQINGLIYNDLINWKYGFYSNIAANNEYLARANSSVQYILNSTNQGYIQMPIPPKPEQQQIVEYLDSKTASIDSVIQTQKNIVEKLKEYKQAVITEAVTKGLNRDVEMKDSGIEWIGEIPNHWGVGRIKNWYNVTLGKMISPRQTESNQTYENYLCAANIKFSGVDTSILKKMWFDQREKKQYLLQDGDVLIMEGGAAGTTCMYKGEFSPCYIQNSVHKVVSKGLASNKYLYYIMNAAFNSGYISDICNKATIMHYTKEKVERTPILFPPVAEQQQIVEYLDSKTARIDKAIEQKNAIIEKLEEYKKSIIYNAVTGKIDCRKDVIPE